LLGRRVGVFNAMPKTEIQFKNIYRRKPRSDQMEYIRDTEGSLKRTLENNSLTSYDGVSKNSYTRFLNKSTEDHVIIVGHNINGELRFADGDKLKIDTMARMALDKKKIPVILSCEARKYTKSIASTRFLNYEDVGTIIKDFGYRWSKHVAGVNGQIHPREINKALSGTLIVSIRQFEKAAKMKIMVKRTFKVAGVVVVVVVVVSA
jgi:hypothetical protein